MHRGFHHLASTSPSDFISYLLLSPLLTLFWSYFLVFLKHFNFSPRVSLNLRFCLECPQISACLFLSYHSVFCTNVTSSVRNRPIQNTSHTNLCCHPSKCLSCPLILFSSFSAHLSLLTLCICLVSVSSTRVSACSPLKVSF